MLELNLYFSGIKRPISPESTPQDLATSTPKKPTTIIDTQDLDDDDSSSLIQEPHEDSDQDYDFESSFVDHSADDKQAQQNFEDNYNCRYIAKYLYKPTRV